MQGSREFFFEDLTRRDLQDIAKEKGRPWDTAKSFESAAPITELHTVADIGHPSSGRIWLSVKETCRFELRQDPDR